MWLGSLVFWPKAPGRVITVSPRLTLRLRSVAGLATSSEVDSTTASMVLVASPSETVSSTT